MKKSDLMQIVSANSGQWFYKQSEIARIFGRNTKAVARLLKDVPARGGVRSKSYFLPDVVEAFTNAEAL